MTDQILESAATDSQARARLASRWLLIMAIVFTVTGVVVGVMTGNEVEKARQALAGHEPEDEFVTPGGQTMTIGELRARLDTEVRRVCVVYFVLASAFLALSFWGRRSPLPAAITGLCLYLVLVVVSAIVEPASLFQGILLKTAFIAVMVKAITSAARENAWRTAARRTAPAEPAATG